MSGPLHWERDGRDWPNARASSFVNAAGLHWHVQQMGSGPAILLIHGTGASSHSWRDVMPLLAENFTVVAADLPGHGFTAGRPEAGLTMPGIAGALSALLAQLQVEPALVVGHSAGAAIALELIRRGHDVPVTGFNAALMPFPGLAAKLFPAMAKILFVNPLVPAIFSRMARVPGEAGRFLTRATGSRIGADGVAQYARLLGNSRHCAGALEMMANWDLEALSANLRRVNIPVLLVHGSGDSAVPASSAAKACRLLPHGTLETWEGLGHLAHEEQPARAAERIRDFAVQQSIAAVELKTDG